jgi:hypothetical protein
MDVKIDIKAFDFTRFNHQVEKTQTAGKLLNYYGDLIQRIEYAINKESVIKDIPHRVSDVPVFRTLVNNKVYTNIFNIKLNNIHKLAEEFQVGFVYLEKLTMSNTSKWLKKHFKNEIKLFTNTYKEVAIKSYFDLRDKNAPIKYNITFNFNGINPDNQAKFAQINDLSKEKVDERGLMDVLQGFINVTTATDIQVISKGQLLDLIEEDLKKEKHTVNEFENLDTGRAWRVIIPATNKLSLFDEGRVYYPKLKIENIICHPNKLGKRFVLSPDSDISYSPDGFLRHLTDIKMKNILNVFKSSGVVSNIIETPKASTYFTFFDSRIRLSDHTKPYSYNVDSNLAEGIDVRVYWNTTVHDAVADIMREIKKFGFPLFLSYICIQIIIMFNFMGEKHSGRVFKFLSLYL